MTQDGIMPQGRKYYATGKDDAIGKEIIILKKGTFDETKIAEVGLYEARAYGWQERAGPNITRCATGETESAPEYTACSLCRKRVRHNEGGRETYYDILKQVIR